MRTYLTSMAALLAAGVVVASAAATFHGKNGRIAFPMGQVNVDIYSAAPDGTGLKRLTAGAGFDACPAFSADGRRIAFCSDRSGKYQLWTMNSDGGDQRVVATRYPALFPHFSPGGRRIVFQANDGSPAQDDVYAVAATGGHVTRLTGAPGNDDYPAFSPDGRTIVFVSHRKPGPAQLWTMDGAGKHQRQLTHDAATKDQAPDWSPDGSQIAYEAAGRIWVVRADGTGQRAVTRRGSFDFAPSWSPDGLQIAFVRQQGSAKQVYVVSAAGGAAHPLYPSGARQLAPAWQPLRSS